MEAQWLLVFPLEHMDIVHPLRGGKCKDHVSETVSDITSPPQILTFSPLYAKQNALKGQLLLLSVTPQFYILRSTIIKHTEKREYLLN